MKTALIITFISSFLFLVFFGRLLKLDNTFKYRQKFSINWVFAAAAVIFTFCVYAYRAYWGGNLSARPPGPVSSLITGNFSEAVLSVIFFRLLSDFGIHRQVSQTGRNLQTSI